MGRRCENCFFCKVTVRLVPTKMGCFRISPFKYHEILGKRFVFGEVKCSKDMWMRDDGSPLTYISLKTFSANGVKANRVAEMCEFYTT